MIRVVVGNGILVAWQPIQKLDPWISGTLGVLVVLVDDETNKWSEVGGHCFFVVIYFINTFRGLCFLNGWLDFQGIYVPNVICFFCNCFCVGK